MSQSTVRSFAGVLLGPADVAVLQTVARYFYLTAAQVTRLLYTSASRTYAQARLKRLVDKGQLQRIVLPRPSRTGSAPFVYTLTQRGQRLLVGWGAVPGGERRVRPAEVQAHSYLHLAHTLALNDVLIALERLARSDPRLTVARVLHERELKQRPVRVHVGTRATSVIPDAWIDLRLAGGYQECYAIELDRGTTEQLAWREKIAALAAYASGPYQAVFATSALTVLVITTAGTERCARLRRWTAASLRALGREDLLELFRFTGVTVDALSPRAYFVEQAHWLRAVEALPTTLLQFPTAPQRVIAREEGVA